jgi:GNAT superfamily N-acetyltransferase
MTETLPILADTLDPADRIALGVVLREYNATQIDIPADSAVMAVLLRDAAGQVEGGFWATSRYGWLHLELAFVPEHRRGAGLGAAMLSALEREVVRRGGRGVRTETGSFQAPAFYARQGYRRYAALDGYPPGHSSLWLIKTEGLGAVATDLAVTHDPDPDDRVTILDALMAHNDQVMGPSDHRPLTLLLRDADGKVAGGLIASTGRRWLHVQQFALPATARRGGLGRRILAMAEAEARARGCVGAYLATASYQARPFYEKQGYAVFGTIDDYLPGASRYQMCKHL